MLVKVDEDNRVGLRSIVDALMHLDLVDSSQPHED